MRDAPPATAVLDPCLMLRPRRRGNSNFWRNARIVDRWHAACSRRSTSARKPALA